jgi:hypothetical protein
MLQIGIDKRAYCVTDGNMKLACFVVQNGSNE